MGKSLPIADDTPSATAWPRPNNGTNWDEYEPKKRTSRYGSFAANFCKPALTRRAFCCLARIPDSSVRSATFGTDAS